jgi:hypothetical protein
MDKKGLIMKKMGIFLAVSFLFLNTAHGNEQESCCTINSLNKNAQEPSFLDSQFTQQFLKGFAAGAIAGVSVEFLRNHILPDITDWNLYGNYGICRDQLTGEAKVAAATLGVAAFSRQYYSKAKLMGAQLAGIIVGACAASYVSKVLTTPAAAQQ